MNENMNTKVEKLRPFTRFCMTIGELPTSYLMSMTYYEQIIWFTKYLQETVIPAINTNATAVEEIQEFLKTLDLQDEVNNKLDEMAESGELEEIMASYLNSKAIFGYDNVESMKSATNLIDGSYAKTLGYYDKNDGGSALYKIRNVTNDDVVDDQYIIEMTNDNLVAELIIDSPIDIRCLGIKGDGVANSDTLMSGLLKHDSFIFKDGSYVFNPLTIENKTKYELYGENAIITGASKFSFTGSSNIKIENLHFDNNTNNCLVFTDCQNVLVEKNDFTNSETATIRMIRTHGNTCKNFKFINNNFIGVSKTNTWGGALYIDGQGKLNPEATTETLPIEQIEVRGNLFEEVGTGGVNFGGAKDVIVDSNIFKNSYGAQNMLSTYTRETTNLVISNNTFSGCGWECCILNYCNKATITGNYFEDFAYGIVTENNSTNIDITNNVINGMKDNRTHTGTGMQTGSYGVTLKDSDLVTVSSNNIYDTIYGVFNGANLNDINIIGNNIHEATNGIGYGGTNGNNYNINIKDNIIKDTSNGILIGTHGIANVINNSIIGAETNNYGIRLDQLDVNSNVTISGNYIKSAIGIDERPIYNINCYQTITNNKIIANDTPLKKYAYNVNIGSINWYNPDIILDADNVANNYVKGSIVNYNQAAFNTNPTGGSTAIGYFMTNVENGVVFIMSSGEWRRKTGGGGSTLITTTNW